MTAAAPAPVPPRPDRRLPPQRRPLQRPRHADGKDRASRNALKHGLTALHHLVLEDEVPDALDALIATVTEEAGATCEIEARLARRLALALWKGERAEQIDRPFNPAPKRRPPQAGFQWEEADPLTILTSGASTPSAATRRSRDGRSPAASRSCACSARTPSWRARTNPRARRKTNPSARRRPPTTTRSLPPACRYAGDAGKGTRGRPLGRAARSWSGPSSTGCWRRTTGRGCGARRHRRLAAAGDAAGGLGLARRRSAGRCVGPVRPSRPITRTPPAPCAEAGSGETGWIL